MATMGMVIAVIMGATPGEATAGMVMDLGGLTVVAMSMVGAGVVGTRAAEFMSAQLMATTQIPTSALRLGTAGIHAPITAMNIRPYPNDITSSRSEAAHSAKTATMRWRR